MKIKALASLSIIISILGVGFGDNFLPVAKLNTQYTCSEVGKMYLNEDSDNNGLVDYWLYLRNNFRLVLESPLPAYNAGQIYVNQNMADDKNTKVYYYSSESDMLQKWNQTPSNFSPLDDSTFKRASRVFPYNKRVRGIDTNNTRILFQKPINIGSNNIVSFLYSYKYSFAKEYDGSSISKYWHNLVGSGGDFHGLKTSDYVDFSSRKRSWSELKTLDNCKNYELYRCGDGKIQAYDPSRINQFTGEVCDDGNNIDGDGCNATCTSIGGAGSCGDGITQEDPVEDINGPEGIKDGIIDGRDLESCDDGEANGYGACTEQCQTVTDLTLDLILDQITDTTK